MAHAPWPKQGCAQGRDALANARCTQVFGQNLAVADAILQRHNQCGGRAQVSCLFGSPVCLRGLHKYQHRIARADGSRAGASVWMARFGHAIALAHQPMRADRVHMGLPGIEQPDLGTGTQVKPKQAAHCARANDRDLHHLPSKGTLRLTNWIVTFHGSRRKAS